VSEEDDEEGEMERDVEKRIEKRIVETIRRERAKELIQVELTAGIILKYFG